MKRLCLAFLLASAVVALSATEKVVVVLDWTVNTNHTGLFVALAKGYFTKAGLDVTVEPAPANGVVGLLATGRADFAFSYQEEVLQSRAQGVPVTAVAAVIHNNTSGFASRASAGILRPKDFEGKRYGGWGSPIEEALLKAMMKADGADSSKVKVESLGDLDFFAATEKTVDFAWVFEGWTVQEAAVRGVKLNYLDMSKLAPVLNEYTPVIVASQAAAAKYPARTKAFLTALGQGYQAAATDPVGAAAIVLKAAPELNAELVKRSQAFLSPRYQAEAKRWGEFDSARWNAFAAWMVDNKLLTLTPAQLKDSFTNAYLP
jgi:ABC-type nitrate/sulfonate/bicarbonate transport system substrate-binding protein